MFKYPSLRGIFLLPPPSLTATIAPINMIYVVTSGSLGFVDPLVVPHCEDVESYGESMMLTMVNIFDPKIPSASNDTDQELHPHMECDYPSPPAWVVDSTSSHDSLDFELP